MAASIPVENLMPLLRAIIVDMRSKGFCPKHQGKGGQTSPKDDPINEQHLFAGIVQEFFKEHKINAPKKYPQFYSKDRHTVAVSYDWLKISLMRLAGECQNTKHKGGRVFIDVLIENQNDEKSGNVVQTPEETYSECEVLIFPEMRCALWGGKQREERLECEWENRLYSKGPKPKPSDQNHDKAAIFGDVQNIAPEDPKRVVRVFISSTFTDTVFERNYALEDVMPYLKKCAAHRGLDVIFSEMRFGIRAEASEDNMTSEICMRELKNCQDSSSGINYVLISGNKYGFRPPPTKIPKAEFEALCGSMMIAGAELVRKFYSLDTNQLDSNNNPAPCYVMLNQIEIGKKFCDGDVKDPKSAFWKHFGDVQLELRKAAKTLWKDSVVELREVKRLVHVS